MKLNTILIVFAMFSILTILSLLGLFKPTGMVAYKQVEIEKEVENEINNIGEARVIITLKDKNIQTLAEPEFKEKHKFNKRISGNLTKKGLAKIKNNPNIEKIYIDSILNISLQDSVPLIQASNVHSLIVKNNLTGSGEAICLVDTGVNYFHQDLGSCFGNNCKVVYGYDFVNDDNDPIDDNGHGTHVAGILAANGVIKGVAPDANIVAMKVCNNAGSCYSSDVLAAIDSCVSNKNTYKISVISISLGGGLYSSYCDDSYPLFSNSINNAISNNISVVISTGNSGSTSQIAMPSCIKNAIATASTTKQDSIASYSNINNITDLLAPGSNIYSTAGPCLSGCSCSGDYMTCSGTSMATPHVSATIALLAQYYKEEYGKEITPAEAESILKGAGKLIDQQRNLSRINAYSSVIASDKKMPEIELNLSQNEITYQDNINITINFSAADTTLKNYELNLTYPNKSLIGKFLNNVILTKENLTEKGNYTVTLFASDFNNNSAISSLGILVKNSSTPRSYLIHPEDNAIITTSNISLTCSSTDDSSLSSISLYANTTRSFSLNQTTNVSGANHTATFNLNLSNVSFVWNCLAVNDKNSSAFADKNYTITVIINSQPSIYSFMPENAVVTINENSSQSFSVQALDLDNNTLTYSWYLDNENVGSEKNYTYNPDFNSAGLHNITGIVSDLLSQDSKYWNVTVNDIQETPSTPSSGGGGGGSSSESNEELKITSGESTKTQDIITSSAIKETCDDGIKNQDEIGIDCGGTCKECTIDKIDFPTGMTVYIGKIFGNLSYNLFFLFVLVLILVLFKYRKVFKKNK